MFYTYKVTIVPTQQFYYGAQYNKKSDPKNLGVSYFTSSSIVQRLIFEYGKNNVKFEIINTHETKQLCYDEEYKFITEHKNDPFCLNRQHDENFSNNIKKAHKNGAYKNRDRTQSEKMKQQWKSEEYRQKMIKSTTGRRWKLSPDKALKQTNILKTLHTNKKCKYDNTANSVWITNGTTNKRIPKTSPIPDGYRKGRGNFIPHNKKV